MKDEFYTKVKIIVDCRNGDLEDYPASNKYTFEFDATDLDIYGYVDQFRKVLRASGFSDKSIDNALGKEP
jgi:hypothetical protein